MMARYGIQEAQKECWTKAVLGGILEWGALPTPILLHPNLSVAPHDCTSSPTGCIFNLWNPRPRVRLPGVRVRPGLTSDTNKCFEKTKHLHCLLPGSTGQGCSSVWPMGHLHRGKTGAQEMFPLRLTWTGPQYALPSPPRALELNPPDFLGHLNIQEPLQVAVA